MNSDRHFLDRPAARVLAGAVFLAAIAVLGYIHRHDLFPAAAPQADNAFAQCVGARQPDLDKMLAEKVISGDQAMLFKSRVEALCRAQTQHRDAGSAGLPQGAQLPAR